MRRYSFSCPSIEHPMPDTTPDTGSSSSSSDGSRENRRVNGEEGGGTIVYKIKGVLQPSAGLEVVTVKEESTKVDALNSGSDDVGSSGSSTVTTTAASDTLTVRSSERDGGSKREKLGRRTFPKNPFRKFFLLRSVIRHVE